MNGQRCILKIEPNGTMSFIYDDEHAALLNEGRATVARLSHVEPHADGGWTADMKPVGGPVLGPFTLRQKAIDEEIKWLEENVFKCSTKN